MAPTHVGVGMSPLEDPQIDRVRNDLTLDALHAIKIRTENAEIQFGGAWDGIPNTRWTRKVRANPTSEYCHVI
ncbi:uncharacterized protein N7479_008599 [Penicillium vulpinum]|uniref:uncharacterized protein n=1 Tax=Penicillium vulpinum TaxID=29845 RepID=UPI002548D213|nr:uncharacterized protein N7479_008599 [Penicillium vulpinum]KAJ5950186.1 hypothetical protein N7479_008599 [Penicillium vulpinum]